MWGFCVRSLFCFAVLCVLSSVAIISLGGGGGEAELLFFCCVLNVMSLLAFLTLPRGAMGSYVRVAFTSLTHLLLES